MSAESCSTIKKLVTGVATLAGCCLCVGYGVQSLIFARVTLERLSTTVWFKLMVQHNLKQRIMELTIKSVL